MLPTNHSLRKILLSFWAGGILVGLYFTTFYNYLLFHSLAEFFSIVVACAVFVIAWNSKNYIQNPYLLYIGIAYLFIGGLDLLHTLSYKGMSIFTDYDYYANQLWIAARYLESITLAIAFLFLYFEKRINPLLVFMSYLLITTVVISTIFLWKIFPVCFVEGQGLTPFKKTSEYIISSILIFNIFLLIRNKARFETKIFHLLLWSLIFTIVSEIAFTFYISNYGLSNIVGHYFKIFSFYLIYKAIIETGITKPFALTFRELAKSNESLNREVQVRKQAEEELEKVIDKLRNALAEVKTLSGLLPICAGCKKIRDDQGYWNQIEIYIRERSEAEFSHGICPDCARELYPGFDFLGDKN